MEVYRTRRQEVMLWRTMVSRSETWLGSEIELY